VREEAAVDIDVAVAVGIAFMYVSYCPIAIRINA
jgi:hypothetical protein